MLDFFPHLEVSKVVIKKSLKNEPVVLSSWVLQRGSAKETANLV